MVARLRGQGVVAGWAFVVEGVALREVVSRQGGVSFAQTPYSIAVTTYVRMFLRQCFREAVSIRMCTALRAYQSAR